MLLAETLWVSELSKRIVFTDRNGRSLMPLAFGALSDTITGETPEK
jgi:hypothetical protein